MPAMPKRVKLNLIRSKTEILAYCEQIGGMLASVGFGDDMSQIQTTLIEIEKIVRKTTQKNVSTLQKVINVIKQVKELLQQIESQPESCSDKCAEIKRLLDDLEVN